MGRLGEGKFTASRVSHRDHSSQVSSVKIGGTQVIWWCKCIDNAEPRSRVMQKASTADDWLGCKGFNLRYSFPLILNKRDETMSYTSRIHDDAMGYL